MAALAGPGGALGTASRAPESRDDAGGGTVAICWLARTDGGGGGLVPGAGTAPTDCVRRTPALNGGGTVAARTCAGSPAALGGSVGGLSWR